MKIREVDIEGTKIWTIWGMLGEMFGLTTRTGVHETGVYLTSESFDALKDEYSADEIIEMIGELLSIAGKEYGEITKREADAERQRRRVQSAEPKKDTVGHIYITKTSIGTKIGISDSGNIEERMKSYKTLPIDIHGTRIYNVLGYRKAEKRLHEHFKGKRTAGEWFDLTDEDIIEAEKVLFNEYESEIFKQ